ncbi:hypothetical protein ACFTAO_26665 [Paenibacillus rhizoplanae]
MHSDITGKFFEGIGFAYEVSFAVDFYQNANTAASVDIRFYSTFSSNTSSFVSCCGQAFFSRSNSAALVISLFASSSAFYNRAFLLLFFHEVPLLLFASTAIVIPSRVIVIAIRRAHSGYSYILKKGQ